MQGSSLSYRQRTIDGPADDLLSIAEAAKYMRHSVKTLRRLIAEGKFPRPKTYPRGGQWVGWMDVVAYLHMADRMQAGQMATDDGHEDESETAPEKKLAGPTVDTEGQGVDRAGQPRKAR